MLGSKISESIYILSLYIFIYKSTKPFKFQTLTYKLSLDLKAFNFLCQFIAKSPSESRLGQFHP